MFLLPAVPNTSVISAGVARRKVAETGTRRRQTPSSATGTSILYTTSFIGNYSTKQLLLFLCQSVLKLWIGPFLMRGRKKAHCDSGSGDKF